MKRISFHSPFPPDECARRLETSTEPDRGDFWENLDRSHVVLGRISSNKVRLRVRHPYSRNALAPIFYGRIEAASQGSVLHGRFRTHPAILAFVGVWFTTMLLFCGWSFVLSGGRIFAGPLLLIAIMALLLGILRWLGRSDRNQIIELIRRTLQSNSSTLNLSL